MKDSKQNYKLSYESDGKMGKDEHLKQESEHRNDREENQFFNITQNSE